jgi:hypothetical protein
VVYERDEFDAESLLAAEFLLRDEGPRRYRLGEQDTSGPPSLDLDEFKRSLGFAPEAKFTPEGGLREPWTVASNKTARRIRAPRIAHRAEALADQLEPEIRRRRSKAVTAAVVFVAYTALTFCWSKTDWQRQIVSAVNNPNATESLSENSYPSESDPSAGKMVRHLFLPTD